MSFTEEYAAALDAHLDHPGEAGFLAAYELGRRALADGISLIELIDLHQRARRAAVADRPDSILDADEFSHEALAAYEFAQRGFLESQGLAAVERERAAVLAQSLEREHRASVELQRSLLPRTLPTMPGATVAARYIPAGAESRVGGDWYDVIELGEDAFGLVVGDVMGHGVQEASLMVALRVAFRAYALEALASAELVDRVDRLFARIAPGHLATAIFGLLDYSRFQLTLVSAGHPPPLRIDAAGNARFLDIDTSLPLGLDLARDRHPSSPVTIEPGTSLLFYSDGLTDGVERAGLDGSAALLDATRGFTGPPAALCNTVLDALVPDEPRDDVCVLAVQLQAP